MSKERGCSTNLDKHLGSGAEPGRLHRLTETAHRLAIARELERELFLPHRLDGLVARRTKVLLAQAGLVDSARIHLLDQHRQSSLRRFTDLLVNTLCL